MIKKVSVKNFGQIITGNTPSTAVKEYWYGNICWVTPTDIGNHKNIYKSERNLTTLGYNNTRALPANTLLITCIASIGKNCILRVNGACNQQINAIIPNAKYDVDYLYYLFCLNKTYLLANAGITATPLISKKDFEDFEFLIEDDKSRQIIIAGCLSDVDELIENLEKLIEKKKNIKLGTMQELLTGKKRLPGFTKEWKENSLGELGVFTGGGVDKKIVAGQKTVTLLNFLDVYHKDFIYKNDLHHIVTASDTQIRKCTLKKGDVFFTPSSEMRTDLAMSAVVMEDCPGCVYSYHITRFRFNDDFDNKFKSYVFNAKYFLDQASLISEGSGKRYVVNLSKFKNLTIKYPTDIKEQSAISKILWDIDQEIQDLEKQLNKYKLLKQGMMEQLLTGKTRLV